MIERLEINDLHIGICWNQEKDYLYDTRNQEPSNDEPFSRVWSSGFTKLTGWILESGKRSWFLDGYRVTAQEVFETLTDEEKAEAIWELNEWK